MRVLLVAVFVGALALADEVVQTDLSVAVGHPEDVQDQAVPPRT